MPKKTSVSFRFDIESLALSLMEELQSDSEWGDDRALKTAASLRALRDQADQTFDSHRRRVSEIEARLNEQLQQISTALAAERLADEQSLAASAEQAETLAQLRQAVDDKEAEVESLLEQLTANSLAVQAQLAERDEELSQLLDLNDEETEQTESLEQELASARQALEELRAQACVECAETRAELTEVGQQLNALNEEFRTLQGQHQTLQAERDELQHASQTAQAHNEQATAALADAELRIADLSQAQQENAQKDEQLDKTHRKFELALADVHKLKRENSELREELLSRPAADDQESPELVSLRAERDALAQRVAELEDAPAPTASVDGQQELEDLQRRFELAVDDVRLLKQENTNLRQQIEAAQTATAAGSSGEAQDWQAQKARLLASLDAEDLGRTDEARRAERATVEGTLTITDRIVAEKDRLLAEREAEIAALRGQLNDQPPRQDLDELRDQIATEILRDNEAVQAECKKLQEQQLLLDAKLREAELEISVQRATLAREQSALEGKLAQLPEADAPEESSVGHKPRRRWLSALGIRDDEEG